MQNNVENVFVGKVFQDGAAFESSTSLNAAVRQGRVGGAREGPPHAYRGPGSHSSSSLDRRSARSHPARARLVLYKELCIVKNL